MKFPSFLGGSYPSQSPIADAERTVNLYVEQIEAEGGANRLALYPTPGFTAGWKVADAGTRALFSMNGRTFAVVGGGFYELFADQTSIKRGVVAIDANPATICSNGAGGHLLITSGGNGYCFVLATNTLTLVLNGEATMGAALDGYFLAFNGLTGKVRLSGLNDGTVWDPTLFFFRSTQPDPWRAMFVDGQRQLWLVGEQSGDVYYDQGIATQPFAPIPGSVFRWGIAAPFAFGLAGTLLVWLGRNAEGAGVVVSPRGYVPVPVSNYAVDTAIAGYSRTSSINDAEVLVYQDEGHTFVNFSFPSAMATWSVDIDKPSWHERGKWNPLTGTFGLWGPRVHCLAFGKHLVGDRSTSTIAIMDRTSALELDGTGIRRVRVSAGLTREHARLPFDRLELLVENGLGVPYGQGSDPVLMLRCSDDGGRTWGNERQASLGRQGEYQRRTYWTRLGVSAHRVFEVSCTEPIPIRIVDAFINSDELRSAA